VLGANPEWGASPRAPNLIHDPSDLVPGPQVREPPGIPTASGHVTSSEGQPIKNGSLGWVFTALALVSTSGPAPGGKRLDHQSWPSKAPLLRSPNTGDPAVTLERNQPLRSGPTQSENGTRRCSQACSWAGGGGSHWSSVAGSPLRA